MYIFTYIYCKEAAVFCTICPFLLLIKFAFFYFSQAETCLCSCVLGQVKSGFIDILIFKTINFGLNFTHQFEYIYFKHFENHLSFLFV